MITSQQRQLGESVDWDHESFTLDKHLSRIVNQVFVRLYEEGLIYKAERMINWCPVNQTALSNIEVEYRSIQGSLYYIKYPVVNGSKNEELLIATTRPETMLGDEALAVHPDDSRYKKFIGSKALIPLMNKEIPIIADSYVDKDFGSGVVKITPGHDPNDFEIGKRHKLPITIVIDEQGKINSKGGIYEGLSREDARRKITENLEKNDFLIRTEKHKHQVGHSYRSGAVVEPMPSVQWFVDAKKLAKEAIRVVEEKKIRFLPERWEKIYFEWMYNIHDWCISRQLWWGHRIPAWYNDDGKFYVGCDEDSVRKKHGLSSEVSLRQEEDVLDTWFSSALWPFATLWNQDEVGVSDWPEPSLLQKNFYPNQVLVTGFDIIFFWVARMIMMGLHFMGDIPFREVYIHGLVRDAERQKMSKSKGNVVNPLEKMEEYGTDAFRFFMISILPEGKDIIYDESRLKGYQSFCNKIWNTARYLWMNQSSDQPMLDQQMSESIEQIEKANHITLSETDLWIIEHFNLALEKIETAISEYRFSEYAQHIYDLIWKFYCDYYVELSKISLKDPSLKQATLYTLNLIFKNMLKLLHPIMPFITEELFSYYEVSDTTSGQEEHQGGHQKDQLSHSDKTNAKINSEQPILVSQWPKKIKVSNLDSFSDSFQKVENIIEVVYHIRNLRGELKIPPGEKLKASIWVAQKDEKTEQDKKKTQQGMQSMQNILMKYREHIMFLSGLSELSVEACTQLGVVKDQTKGKGIKQLVSFGEIFLDVANKIDMKKEKERLTKEKQKIEKELTALSQRIDNQDFIKKAPQEVIIKEKERIAFLERKQKEIQELWSSLNL